MQLYVNRYHLVAQRLKRNKLFRTAQFAGLGGGGGGGAGGGGSECELTELMALLGVVGVQRYVMGFLTQVRCAAAVAGGALAAREQHVCLRASVHLLAVLSLGLSSVCALPL